MKNSTSKKTILLFLFFAVFFVEKVAAQSLTLTVTPATNCTPPCNGTATAPYNAMLPSTYVWNTNPVQTTVTATGLCPGPITVTVTAAIGSQPITGTVGGCGFGVFDITTASSLSVFPNPANESVSLDLSTTTYGNYSLSVITILGETIHTLKNFLLMEI